MLKHSQWLAVAVATMVWLAGVQTAQAHPGHSMPHAGGWTSGLLHPLLGLDHLLAMLASGLLAVRMGTQRALWLAPLAFLGLMLLGGALAALGVALPLAEWGIALSVLVLGLAVAMLPRVPLAAGAALVGLFAVCHGYAHVAEAGSLALAPYVAGFSLATLALHAAAIGLGVAADRAERPQWVRGAGAGIAAAFVLVLIVG